MLKLIFSSPTSKLLVYSLVSSTPLVANPITWSAVTPASDMNNAINWSPSTVPGVSDHAIFDSSILNVEKDPKVQGANFSVSTFQFTNSASPFIITVDNQTLLFSGLGITGRETNTTINTTNTNNSLPLGTQISFTGSVSSSGAAILNIQNVGTQTGGISGASLNTITGQFLATAPFTLASGGYLSLVNSGEDNSTGTGNNLTANLTSYQGEFNGDLTVGDNALLSCSNNGSYFGSNSVGGNSVGLIQGIQFYTGGNFQAGDAFGFTVMNSGINSSTGAGNNFVGAVKGAQANFNANCTLGNEGLFFISNQGTNGSGTLNTNSGYILDQQLFVGEQFSAGNGFNLMIRNLGSDDSSGVGGGLTSLIDTLSGTTGYQALFNSSFTVGDQAILTTKNTGTCSGTKTMQGVTVSAMNQNQMLFSGPFIAGHNLTLTVSNSGEDSSESVGPNFIGNISNCQLEFDATTTLGDNATIQISNTGNFRGNLSPQFSYSGFVGCNQLQAAGNFQAGNALYLNIENSGIYTGNSAGNDYVGATLMGQVDLLGACNLGDNATLLISNSGTNTSSSTSNNIGYCLGSQFQVGDDFSAGNTLNLTVTNTAVNTGNSDNNVGFISGSQVLFQNACSIHDGSLISASNSGTVTDSQIGFNQGFNVLSGKATIQATNQGIIGTGISIQGNNSGGNANIILENSSLVIDTSLLTFTIGELNGDSTSTAESQPALVINTDASTSANFAGVIQNFPATASTLTKQGSGTQKLSGTNTYTGLTTVQEGSFILTGSIARDLNVDPLGILKGTGTIGGSVVNAGTISPGESIGTLTILENFTNNLGNYDVEVNGLGQSDLIDVGGTTTLNGGVVFVSTVDGSYQFEHPYTIVDAANVTGQFTGVAPLSPVLNPTLSYDAEHVYLTLQTALTRVAKTSNQLAVAERLDALLDPTANQSLLLNEIVDLSIPDVQEALTSLSGYQHTDDLITSELLNRQFIRRLYDPLRSLVTTEPSCCDPCSSEWVTFMETGGGFTSIQGNENAHGFNLCSFEFTTGIQKSFNKAITFGIAGSYAYDHQDYREGGNGDSNSCLLGLYALYRPACYYALGDIGYGYTSKTIHRSIVVGLLNYRADSHPEISQTFFYGEVGGDIRMNCLLVQPFVGVEVSNSWRKHLRENEPHGWGFSVHEKDHFIGTSRLGFHLTTAHPLFDVSLDVAWNCLLSNRRNTIRGEFIEFGDSYNIQGINLSRNSVDYALTLTKSQSDCLNVYLEILSESWNRFFTINGLVGLTYRW